MEFISSNPFFEFAFILALAALLGAAGQFFKQPLIVVFIVLGIVVGPSGLDVVKSKDNIHLLAELGISILLFIVGLKLDLRIIESIGKIALVTGLGQVAFTSLIGYFLGILLGFLPLHSFYIAVALTFSSTVIIVKLLSDKKEIDSLHGQIAIGFLIVQDIVVILAMIVLSAMGKEAQTSLFENILQTLWSGLLLLGISLGSMRYLIPAVSAYLARSSELLTLFSVSWAVSLAALGQYMDFSGEVGAFLAGVSLASSNFKDTIGSRLVSLRDFLLLFFFVHLGSNLKLEVIGSQAFAGVVFSVFVLIGNPLIVLVMMGAMGYRKRTSFLAGLTVAQISEFSLIFAGLGLAVGHITEEVVGLITLVGLITIGLSTYMILYSHYIYEWLAPVLGVFEKKNHFTEEQINLLHSCNYDVVIVGLGRFGNHLATMLDEHPQINYLGVDFDPNVVAVWKSKDKNIVYGDLEDPDLVEHLPLARCKAIVNTVPNFEHSKQFVHALKKRNFEGKIYLTASNEADYGKLSGCNADGVLMPHKMAATNFYNYYLKKAIDLPN